MFQLGHSSYLHYSRLLLTFAFVMQLKKVKRFMLQWLKSNSSFNPNPLRSTNNMAGRACHVVGSTTQVGLTQALAPFKASHMTRFLLLILLLAVSSAASAIVIRHDVDD